MASGRRRKKNVTSPPCDIIGDLPDNVIETILVCLPLRDAVRTSILSRKWRYSWANIPQLVFDDTFCQESIENEVFDKNKLLMIIYQVLLLHRGPILKFTLSVSLLQSSSEIDQLIVFLSRNGVEEITLQFGEGDHYNLPSSFFSCLQLRQLNLHSCVFRPPHFFNGFSRLTNLDFKEVDFDADLFGNLISSCPLLEDLSLENCTSFNYLEIDAPMLKSLSFNTNFNSIRFKKVPLLELLSITSDGSEHLEHLVEGQTSKMIEVFGCLPVIENLYFGYHFLKFLSLGGVPEKLPFTLNHLKILELYQTCLGERDEVSVALCLIKSSPNLEEIVIEVFASTSAAEGPALELLKVQDYSDFSLNQLREVNISLASGSRPELEFIKLILANSPMLEKMHIEPNSQETFKGLWMLKQLTRFGRASPKAEILFKDSAEDPSLA